MNAALAALARRAALALDASGLQEAGSSVRAQLARLQDPLVTVAILGEFKRGKSTLINALVAQVVLPAGVLPLTAVRTAVEVTADGGPAAQVSYRNGERAAIAVDEIARFATEEGNPANRRGVAEVTVRVPAQPLVGMRLIDTPGLASPFVDTAAAAEPAAADADVAVIVLAADQPASRAELELLERAAGALPTVVVVNRMDAIDTRDRERVLGFVAEQVRRVANARVPVVGVSARGALDASPEWRERIAELRKVILESMRRADRPASVRRALRELLASAVSRAALQLSAPRLKDEARAAHAARHARDLQLAALGAASRCRPDTLVAGDEIIKAVNISEERASSRSAVVRAALTAATSAVRSGHDPGAAVNTALELLLSRWTSPEANALEAAIPAQESNLGEAIRAAIGMEFGPAFATTVRDVRIALDPPRPHLSPLRAYGSVLPGPLGRWCTLRRFRHDLERVADSALEARRAAVEAAVRAAIDLAIRSVLDRLAPEVPKEDDLPVASGDPAAALRSLLVELGG